MKKTTIRTGVAALALAISGVGVAGVASADPAVKVDICHATGTPDTAGNGYVAISPSASGVYNGHLNLVDGQLVIEEGHEADIIPPFTWVDPKGESHHFAGQNWDAEGQAVHNNGSCDGTVTTPTTPPTTEPTTPPTTEPTTPPTTTEPTTPPTTTTTPPTTEPTTPPSTTTSPVAPPPAPGPGPSTPGVVQTDGGPMGSPAPLLALLGLGGAALAAEITRRKLAYARQH